MAAPLKLGELLVQEGVITPQQLEEALKYQVIFGGKLGTNLIELDFVEEDDIAKTLSRMLHVPLVPAKQLEDIPSNIIKLIPRDIAEQYRVIPLQLDNRKLTLVMANPSDLKAIDEIAFRTGYVIRPAVAAEVRLILALETYYNIPREIRYIQVSKKVELTSNEADNRIMTEEVRAETATQVGKMEEERVRQAKGQQAKPKPTQTAGKAKQEKAPQIWPEEEQKKPAAKPAPAANPAAPPAKPQPRPKPVPAVEEVVDLAEADIIEEGSEAIDVLPIEEVFKHLADPADREDIADRLITHLGHEVERAALFQIRGKAIQGWKLNINDKPKTDFGQFQASLDHPSVLKTVIDTASFYIGPIPETSPDNKRLIESMGGNPPSAALLMPVMVMGRVVTVIYLDDKQVDLPTKLIDLQKMAAKMAMAFEILILKNKILMM